MQMIKAAIVNVLTHVFKLSNANYTIKNPSWLKALKISFEVETTFCNSIVNRVDDGLA